MSDYIPSSTLEFEGTWKNVDTTLEFGKSNSSEYEISVLITLPQMYVSSKGTYNPNSYTSNINLKLPVPTFEGLGNFYNKIAGNVKYSLPLPVLDVEIVLRAQIFGNVNIKIDILPENLSIQGLYDSNIESGTYISNAVVFESSKNVEKQLETNFNRSDVLKTSNVFSNEYSIFLGSHVTTYFEKSNSIETNLNTKWEKTQLISTNKYVKVSGMKFLSKGKDNSFKYSDIIGIKKNIQFEDMSRVIFDNGVKFSNSELVYVTSKNAFSNSLLKQISKEIRFESAKRIYYSHNFIYDPVVEPGEPDDYWPLPPIKNPTPTYKPNPNINFNCIWESPNTNLNFGDSCQPQIRFYDSGVVFVNNQVSLNRVDDGREITLSSLNVSCDMSTYLWSFSASLPSTELNKVNILNEDNIELELNLNGFKWIIVVDSCDDSYSFSSSNITVKGQSRSVLLSSPHFEPRSYKIIESLNSRQIVENELNRNDNPTGFSVDWNLVSDNGWQVPANTYSYVDKTPINVLQDIASSAGGFINTHPYLDIIKFLPKYPVPSWEWDNLDPTFVINSNLITSMSRSRYRKPDYNGILVSGEHESSASVLARLTGSDGSYRPSMITHPLITEVSVATDRAKSELSSYGDSATVSVSLPLIQQLGLPTPSDFIKVDDFEPWVGIIRGVDISCSIGSSREIKIEQKLKIERHFNKGES